MGSGFGHGWVTRPGLSPWMAVSYSYFLASLWYLHSPRDGLTPSPLTRNSNTKPVTSWLYVQQVCYIPMARDGWPQLILCGKSYRCPAPVTCLPSADTRYSPGASTGNNHQYQEQVHHQYRIQVTSLHGPCTCASLSKDPKNMLPTFCCTYLN